MVFHRSEALSAIFMPKIEYCTTLLTEPVCKQVDEELFISDELCQGGLSMPDSTSEKFLIASSYLTSHRKGLTMQSAN